MSIGLGRYPGGSTEMKPGFLKGCGVHCCDSSAHAIFAVYQGSQGNDDAVITASRIIIKVEESSWCKYGNVILEFF